MNRFLNIIIILLILLLPATALATGTPAGTPIVNIASAVALINGLPVSTTSNPAAFIVDEVLDLTLTWQDSSNVNVEPGALDQMLTFLLTNTGNGSERFTLALDDNISGDQFDPLNSEVYLDNNDNGIFDPGTDLPYDSLSNIPTLAADNDIVLFVFGDIPNGLSDDDTGTSRITATAETGSGSAGDAFPPTVPGDPHSIVGASGGEANADGIYQVSSVSVALIKTVQINDLDGGDEPVSGATLTYSILVEITGTSTTTNLIVVDPIPTDTTYIPESMTLFDGITKISLTDIVDSDEGTYLENPVGSGNYEVNYQLGNLSDTNRTVTFQVIID